MQGLNRIFMPGSSHGEATALRTEEAKELRATTIPIFSLLAKDHKWTEVGQDPKTRGVCYASKSINGEMSEYVSDILDAVSNERDTGERISSEDLLHSLDKLAKQLREPGMTPSEGITVCSIDAESLYPKMKIKECARLGREAVENST